MQTLIPQHAQVAVVAVMFKIFLMNHWVVAGTKNAFVRIYLP